MKKNIFLGLAIAFVSLNTFAQVPAPTPAAKPAGVVMQHPAAQQHPMADAATRTQKYTDRLTKSLGLDAATAQKVSAAYLARTKKVDEIQASNQDGKAKNAALKANKDAFETALKGILSADQFDKYTKMESDHKGKK